MKYLIEGGHKLSGSIPISGSKNAVLPILAATVITGQKTVLHNCPDISDVHCTVDILKYLGCHVEQNGSTITVDSQCESHPFVPAELMKKLRSSIIFLGAFINRFGSAQMTYPGGCELGKRPIDIHLSILSQMGVEVSQDETSIFCKASNIRSGEYCFPFPSVGATENVMIAALIADGPVTLKNPAKEPEIVELQNFLNAAGAHISGAGTDTIHILPQQQFGSCEYTIASDRIEAATYMAAAAATGSTLTLTNAPCHNLKKMTDTLREMGVYVITRYPSTVTVIAPRRLKPVNMITTMPYPGFPTDAQAILMAALLKADGKSMIVENIFENRYHHVEEFRKMGADITLNGNTARIRGVKNLHSAVVSAGDLRAGAALVIAALSAEGITEIHNICHIERGYENMTEKLRAAGAVIHSAKNREQSVPQSCQIIQKEKNLSPFTLRT